MSTTNLVFGSLLFFLMWGVCLYQLNTGKLLGRDWKVWTTRKERAGLYWTVVVVQGLGILFGSIMFIRDALR